MTYEEVIRLLADRLAIRQRIVRSSCGTTAYLITELTLHGNVISDSTIDISELQPD